MSSIYRTRRPATGLALAAVLGLGTSFGLMAAPASADTGNGNGNGNANGQVGAPAQAGGQAAPQSAPQSAPQAAPEAAPQSSEDKGEKGNRGNGGKGATGNPGGSNGNPGASEGNGGKGNPGTSNPDKGNPGKGNPGKSEGNGGKGAHGNPGTSNPGKGDGDNPGKGKGGKSGKSGKSEGNNDDGPKAGNGDGGTVGGGPGTGAGAPNDDQSDTPAAGDPAGNNGTIKITPVPHADGIPQNFPHPGCQFQIEWYGFDADAASPVISTVSFAVQAPTDGDVSVTSGDTTKSVGGDAQSGAGTDTGFDGSETYTLAFTGTPHPKQGYHVKVTVSTPFANGNDTKSKVFWVSGCTTEATGGGELGGGDLGGDDTTTDTTTTETNVLGQQATQSENSQNSDTVESVQENTENTVAAEQNPVVDVLGEQATAAVKAALGAAGTRTGAVVPTVINAGVAGKEVGEQMSGAQSALALLMLLLAGASARLAWLRRTGA